MNTFTIYSDGHPICTARAVIAEIHNGHLYLLGTDECSDTLVAIFTGKALGAVRQEEDIPGSTMSVREFRKKGYLQELNRQFLHPLGLAIEVRVEQDGTETFGGLWDYRSDSEGICYDTIDEEKAAYIIEQQEERAIARQEALGYVVQPLIVGKAPSPEGWPSLDE